jgi:hypothetical protein
MISDGKTAAETRPYIVVVDADYESEWYLTPMRFPTHLAAMRYAAGIANAWYGRSGAPTISIKGPERIDRLSINALHFLGMIYNWFEDFSVA